MWFLRHFKSDKIVYLKKKKTTVGRIECDIEIKDDASLSRAHAVLIHADDMLMIQDCNSKYGTFLNDRRAPNEKLGTDSTQLKNGDKVTFGKLGNEWEVHHFVQKTAFSMLLPESKKKLEMILAKFGAECTDTFDESCTHLTMSSEVTVSEKLLRALSSCTPVVTPKYWIAVQESFRQDQTMPKFIDFVPIIKEDAFVTPGTVSLALNDERTKLFAGKHFFFFTSKQMDTFANVIRNAGGKCSSLSKVKVRDCCAKHSIVIQPKAGNTQSQNEDTISTVKTALNVKSRRMVPLTEIGLAVLYCSIEKWCNPDFCPETLFQPSLSGQLMIAKSKVLAIDTDQSSNAEVLDAPSTSRGRGRPKKIVPVVSKKVVPPKQPPTIIAYINLEDDDDEDENIAGKNKENIGAQNSHSNIVIPETEQEDSKAHQEDIMMAQSYENLEIPETAESAMDVPDISIMPETPVEPDLNTEKIFKKPQSDVDSHRSNRSHQSSSNYSSAPGGASDLFNFTNSNMNDSKRSQRKRKNSSDDEASEPTANSLSKKKQDPKPIQAPTAKRNKQTRVIDQEEKASASKPSRKRQSEVALDGGLFNFNIIAPKKNKPNEARSRKQDDNPVGLIAVAKTCEPSQPVYYDHLYDFCDSGVWLSKKMKGVKLEDSVDSIKSEITENDPSIDTQDFKLDQLDSLFTVLDASSEPNTTVSSMVSTRKQFVKKHNYKQQSCIVTMKLLSIEDTYISPNDF